MKTTCTADAAVRLMLKFPFWSELYYSMGVTEDTTIPTLCTDGRNMWVNPEFWQTLTLDLKISALAHEVCHKMLLHSSRRGHRDVLVQSSSGQVITLWNIAADHVVNNLLRENGFKISEHWIMDEQYTGWSVEAVYADLEKKLEKNPQGGGGAKGQGQQPPPPGGQQPQDGDGEGDGEGEGDGQPQQGNSLPGLSDKQVKDSADLRDVGGTKEEIEKYEQEVQRTVQKAVMMAKAAGKVPLGVEMALDDAYEESKEPWYNHLHRFMQSLSQAEYNWAKLNKKMGAVHGFFAPHHYSEALGEIVIAIDTSGSVYEAAVQSEFAAHVNAILGEAKPEKVHVLYFDAVVQKVEEIERGELDFKSRPKGGGGTAFEPIFEHIEQEGLEPAVAIILTDTMGSFPAEAPEYPVIWASIWAEGNAPFGEVIYVE